MRWLPAHWSLWSAPAVVIGYVLAVDALALAVTGISSAGLDATSDDWIRLAVLIVASAIHVEAGRDIERLRRKVAEGTTSVNLQSVWTFAAVLILPLSLAIAVSAFTSLHSWARRRRSMPHRVVFSASTLILASAVAAMCLHTINPGSHPGYTGGLIGLVAVVGAAVAYWFINYALVVGAVMLSNPNAPAHKALGQRSDQLIVAGGLGLGLATSLTLEAEPWLTITLLITVLGLHRALLVGQFQSSARTDPLTGLANAVFWHEIAAKELERAHDNESSLVVLYLDLDHFKAINDSHGHQAGDDVLKAIAATLEQEVRAEDLVGRLGGEEFAILLPNTDAGDTVYPAERIRRRIASLVTTVTTPHGSLDIDGLTCSIGTATYPTAGRSLDVLLMAADNATYAAKNAGRNRVVAAPTNPATS
ncbi:sensor domain-containing diguanylate cyclase [Promicromonospora iranensis]|uniref:Diguanylate cyclase (GGDEF)-like protein n=1 Tax=Promicromonospora iranensis TaxID=1105144 RepID=A0ABU2CLX0_9MICO|nr:GGDEF domain-containing protein [Promicromonospora iranensis]MDR7382347.1 diguanylate cyclase (GGDEF)-like protein [Promicromonospora iranensis]